MPPIETLTGVSGFNDESCSTPKSYRYIAFFESETEESSVLKDLKEPEEEKEGSTRNTT